jgi:exopolyphosphatase / guanosine-5'-triphosphate,3'-diphosphate pyrophosphatase
MRVAAIDIGTNSVLLLIAQRDAYGQLVALEEHATITRLGEGVDHSRELLPLAIARTNTCLDAYAELIRAAGVERIAVVGTSAMRDAKGGESVQAHVRETLGVEARVISGDEEARLTFSGALSGLGYEDEGREIVVFDIGGGSTEIVCRRPTCLRNQKNNLRFPAA